MNEHGLIFGAVSMRGILDGRKTMTRRVVSFHNSVSAFSRKIWNELDFDHAFVDMGPSPLGNPGPYLKVPFPKTDGFLGHERHDTRHRVYPRVQVGDVIRCKETFRFTGFNIPDNQMQIRYRADGDYSEPVMRDAPKAERTRDAKWRSPIFMPRWVSRAFLPVIGVVVQRVQEISEADAIAEGAFNASQDDKQQAARVALSEGRDVVGPVDYFHQAWDTINAKRGHPWSRSDWVWGYQWKEVTR